MRLLNINVKNYKCHRDSKVDFSNFHVLIGKNNSGKTSMIECFKLLKDYYGKSAPDLRTKIFGGINETETKEITFTVEIELNDNERNKYFETLHFLEYQQDYNQTSFLRKIRMEFRIIYAPTPTNSNYQNKLFLSSMQLLDEKNEFFIISTYRGGADVEVTNFGNIDRKTIELNKTTPIQWLQRSNTKISIQDFEPHKPELPQITIVNDFLKRLLFILADVEREIPKVFKPGEKKNQDNITDDLVDYVHKSRVNDEDTFQKMKQFGTSIHSDIEGLTTEILPNYDITLRLDKKLGEKKLRTYFTDQGKGIENTLIFTTRVSTSPMGSIWFIDEPELHQHPEAQNALYRSLIDLSSEGRQIIISTQSMIFAHKSKPSQISLFSIDNSNEGKVISLDSFLSSEEDLSQNERDQIYKHLGYNPEFAFEPKTIVIVEGIADKQILTIFSEILNQKISEREVKIIPLEDKRKAERYCQFVSRAVLGKNVIITLDNDYEKPESIKNRILDFERDYANYLKLKPVLNDDNFYLYPEEVYSIEYYLLNAEAILKACQKSDKEILEVVKERIKQGKDTRKKPKDILIEIWESDLKQGNYHEVDTAALIAKNVTREYLEGFPAIIKLINRLTSS